MDPRQQSPRSIPAILWPLALGTVGFLAGFIGPVILNPEANQGPLLGIFMTGPGGVILGLLLLLFCRLAKLASRSQAALMVIVAVGYGLWTLSLCLPDPQLRGYAVEVQIEKCQTPAQVIDASIKYWDGRVANTTWATPRAGWQEDARAKADSADGVVLDTVVVRQDRVFMNRKPWDKGSLGASAWSSENKPKSYYAEYAGSSCADYPVGQKTLLFTRYDVTGMSRGKGDWPPRSLADFLDRALLEKLPDEYRSVVPQ